MTVNGLNYSDSPDPTYTMDLQVAATLLSILPAPLSADVVMCMANPEQISDVIKKITIISEQKLRSLADLSRESNGDLRAIAELIKLMDFKAAAAILSKIKKQDPALARNLQNIMFMFEDVLRISDAGMREILQHVDKKCLTVALKGTSDELKDQFFRNMSRRAVEMMLEDLHILGPVKAKDVETAQRQIAGIIQKLCASGIVRIGCGRDDEYVDDEPKSFQQTKAWRLRRKIRSWLT
jgi:flagellar motor switch protein FliG